MNRNQRVPQNNDQRLARAAELFRLRGGEGLKRAQRLLDGTLDVYEQDLQRTRSDNSPEKFRWRVKPAEAMRAMREQQRLQAALEELLTRCHDEAMAGEPAAQHETATPAARAPEARRGDPPPPAAGRSAGPDHDGGEAGVPVAAQGREGEARRPAA